MSNPLALFGNPEEVRNPRVVDWLTHSRVIAIGWTAMRIWLGVMWIQAGVAKLWGAEAAGFIHNGGAGVKGFASHGTAAYSWWGSFLHGFVVPNAGWIGVLVAVAEFVIGIALCLGLFTRLAALGSLALLFTYNVRHRERVRLLRPVRDRHPRHVEDVDVARPRRSDRRLPPASPWRASSPQCHQGSRSSCVVAPATSNAARAIGRHWRA